MFNIKLNTCRSDVGTWMINNKLTINDKKTECLIIKYFYNKANFDDVILEVGDDIITP